MPASASPHTFLIATVALPGHVQPLVPIARELVRRGHDVIWMTGRAFRDTVEATGAQFEPLGMTYDPDRDGPMAERYPGRAGLEGLDGIRFDIKHGFLDQIRPQVQDLRWLNSTVHADAVIADAGFMGAAVFHELGGPPVVSIGITPLVFASRDVAPFGTGLPPIRGLRDRLRASAILLAQRLMMRDVERHHVKVRDRLGLPPSPRSALDTNFSRELFLQTGTEAFEYPRSDLPDFVRYVGPLISDSRPSAEPVDWVGLAAGRPLVLVTQGTLATDASDLIAPTLAALADENVLVVAVSADGADGVEVPANAIVEKYVPYHEVMPHASVVITNGGMGGVQQALAAGAPLIVAGTTEDKPEVAARVEWTGTGLSLRTARPTPDQVRTAVRRLLDEPSFRRRAGEIRDDYAMRNAGVEAAYLIENLVTARSAAPAAVGTCSGKGGGR